MSSAASIDDIIEKRKIVITCGTGGVGKTTMSAAIALRAAKKGKKACVLTIDPAKRLATSLGVQALNDEPTKLNSLIPGETSGEFYAVVPDTRKTMEDVLGHLAPDEKFVEKMRNNEVFQMFSKDFSGSNEYMALLRMEALVTQGKFDFIVLDTPPSRNTVAFLNAPLVLNRFFEEKIIRWLLKPANKILGFGVNKVFGILESLAGNTFVKQLMGFAKSMMELREDFTAKLRMMANLFESQDVGFVMVAAPNPELIPDVRHFQDMLEEKKFQFDGLILNRSVSYFDCKDVHLPSTEYKREIEILEARQKRENLTLSRIELGSESRMFAKLPEFVRDIHCIEDLSYVADAIH